MKHKRLNLGFTMLELMVVLFVSSLLITLLLPAFARVREEGNRTVCKKNLQSIFTSVTIYSDVHDGNLPGIDLSVILFDGHAAIKAEGTSQRLGKLFPEYLSNPDVLWCPSRKASGRFSLTASGPYHGKVGFLDPTKPTAEISFGHVTGGPGQQINLSRMVRATTRIMAYDVFWRDGPVNSLGASVCHKDGYYNTLYFDGHWKPVHDQGGYLETIDVSTDPHVITNTVIPMIESDADLEDIGFKSPT